MPRYRIYFGRETSVDIDAASTADALAKFDDLYSDEDLEAMLQEVPIQVADVWDDMDRLLEVRLDD